MRIIKCDFCKKNIRDKPVNAGVGFYQSIELCDECGLPILKFLQKHKIIDKDKKEIKKN